MKDLIKIIGFIVFSSTLLFSQVNQTSTDKNSMTSNQFQFNSSNKSNVNVDASQLLSELNTPIQNFNSIPVEGVVNADKYIVGQGDIFSLGLYGFLNQIIPLTVNIEGSIIIPSVGEVKVSDLTLAQAKEKVISAVKKRYYSSSVSFTLAQPRTFLIPVSGLTQGTYTVTSLTRPSQLLSIVVFDTLNMQKRVDYKKTNDNMTYSLRNIELKRKDGSIAKVDIYKYFSTKEEIYNPTLKEGDLLRIPYTNLNTYCITVSGAVEIPGHYEYNQNDDLETVIGLGRGFDANANPDSIIVYRTSSDSRNFKTYFLSYENDKKFKIEVFDRVFVKYKSDFRKMVSVIVQGEILRPGIYPITFKNTRLKDVIEMAGGMTKNAYLPLCIVFRTYDEEYLKRDTMELMVNRRANDLIISEKDKLNFEEDVRGRRNRMVVDFEKLFKENDESQNIILEDKDVIYINDNKNSVYVYGQVQNEGYVPFKEGEDYEYYIEKAGGYSLAADKGNARIIKFNSRGWYKPDEVKLNSGDFVYIPKKTTNTFAETVTVISQIASVILGILTTYILIKNTQ